MEILKEKELLDVIEKVCADQGLSSYRIANVEPNSKGEGYLSEIFSISIEDATCDKKLDIVIKLAFSNQMIRQMVPIRSCFLNEIIFYTDIYPAISTMIFDGERQFIPKCYQVSRVDGKEMLCLENLKVSKFSIFNKSLVLDDDHLKFIFKTYGEYHGYIFALKHKKSKEYTILENKVINCWEKLLEIPNGGFPNYLKDTFKIAETFFKDNLSLAQKFSKYSEAKIVDTLMKIVLEKCNNSLIIHGDCWSNNMMFKYQETEGGRRVSDIKLLDFQLTMLGSPVYDLSYCLYSGGTKQHFDKLNFYLEIYYESLATTLNKLDCNPNLVYPFEDLKSEWTQYCQYGMIMAFAILRAKTATEENTQDFTDLYDKDEEQFSNCDVEEFKKRALDVVLHMVEINVL